MQKTPTLRTDETEARYQAMKDSGALAGGCRLCEIEPIETFKFWKLIPNEFPYDKITARHDMIVPLRHTAEINDEERAELMELRRTYINENYRYIMEATTRTKSIPAHFHLQLIEIK
ncbi:MAG TPA: hypothetical protein VG984_01085 [Candidatus Paceibacterota bacterium]|nr:hypothetical protein [Candidatus Paceibacterota bacterium]